MLQTITLIKGEEIFVFRYEKGKENQIISHMAKLVSSRATSFDNKDLEIIFEEMAKKIEEEIKLTKFSFSADPPIE